MGFVCAFRGRRDAYQVPLALDEAGDLDLFITDLYASPAIARVGRLLPPRLSARIRQRYEPRLSSARVERLPFLACREYLMRRSGTPPDIIFGRCDPVYTALAERRAREMRSDLFLYSPHAWEALQARYAHAPRKIVFQFHPHYAAEERLLRDDAAAFRRQGLGDLDPGIDPTQPDSGRWRSDEAWRFADHVVCASSFTRETLLDAGADPARISVVPYGIDVDADPPEPDSVAGDPAFRVLFVGTGFQRKGLHRLVTAWRAARLPPGARLTVVSRSIDPDIATLLAGAGDVEVLSGVSGADLAALYRSSSLFAMPSLVEGFGQVFLEALSYGLPVLGTANTCLPDLGRESDGIFMVSPGSQDDLVWRLESLSRTIVGDGDLRRNAKACAARFSWERFRAGIRVAAAGG